MITKYIISSLVTSVIVSAIVTRIMANHYFIAIDDHIDKTIALVKKILLAKEYKL